MKRFFSAHVLAFCILEISAVQSLVAANRTSSAGELACKPDEKATVPKQTAETLQLTSANAPAQSARDLLPEGGVIVLGPDPYSWRLWPGGKIEFSYTGSHTWEIQKSGVTADLTAGSAPTGKVCWVVGKTGTVLLTTDRGKHWKQVAAPTKENLVGVDAQDGKRASVWTASHQQSFDTNDAGSTWSLNSSK